MKSDYRLWTLQVLIGDKTKQSLLHQPREDRLVRIKISGIGSKMSNVKV